MPLAAARAPSSSGPVEAPVKTPTRKGFPSAWSFVHAAGKGGGELLGIAGAGETAHADVVAIADEGGGLIGGHDALT